LRRGGIAPAALPRKQRVAGLFFSDIGLVLFIHVRAGFPDGESAHHKARGMIQVPPQYAIYPILDALLNGTSAVLLVVGHQMIKQGRMAVHRALMLTALLTSSLFLISYLYYHAHVGSVRFQGQGWSRPV